MYRYLTSLLVAILFAAGCMGSITVEADDTAQTDTDSDSDTDADSDTDTDVDLLETPFPDSLWYYELDGPQTVEANLENPEIEEPDLDKVHVYTPDKDVPWIPVYSPGTCDDPGDLQTYLPVPSDVAAAEDNSLSVFLHPEDSNLIAEANWFNLCDDGAYAVGWLDHHGDGEIWHDLDGDGWFWGAQGGSHLSALGGTIRVGEISSGSIDHVVKVELDNGQLYYSYDEEDNQSGYRWPAHSADSYASMEYAGENVELQMGSILTLPAGYQCGDLLTAEAATICEAMQIYGALVVDDTYYQGAVALVIESGVDDELEDLLGYGPEENTGGWFNDMRALFAALTVVTDPEEFWDLP